MRTRLAFLAALLIAFPLASCSDFPELTDSSFTMKSSPIIFMSDGGMYAVPYIAPSGSEASVEAVCRDGWIKNFDYSAEGVISFTVDPNTTDGDRQTAISVFCGDETVTFQVMQHSPKKVLTSELQNARYTATICMFDAERTTFYFLNPENTGEFYWNPDRQASYITAGVWASEYAVAYNRANPDAQISSTEALGFDFTGEIDGVSSFYDVAFYNGNISISNGQVTPIATTEVIRCAGPFTYDESTGTITVTDEANTLYTREVTIHIEKSGDNIIMTTTHMPQPSYMSSYLKEEDLNAESFNFTLANYAATEYYMPYNGLTYTLRYLEPVY